jgi:choline dehydrogenase
MRAVSPRGSRDYNNDAVHDIERLRVVDASIIREVPSTVTNLTVIMLAERIFQRVYL